MNQTNRIGSLAFASLLSLPISGCTQVCGPLEYPEAGSCSAGLTTRVSTTSTRIDLRDPNQTLTLKIDLRRTKTDHPLKLFGAPKVELAQDGEASQAVQVRLGSDARSVEIVRSPDQLRLGAVDATVTIGDLAPMPLEVAMEGGERLVPRVYRKPQFQMSPDITLPLGVVGPRSGSIRGRTAVQVAGPFGESGRLLVTATADTVVGAVRWQELFSAQPGSKLAYDASGVWNTEQLKQQEGPTALLALGKGAVLIYDIVMGRGDLALLPLLGTRINRLSTVATQVPMSATALAACAEESLVFLAEANQVQAFAFDPTPAALPLRHLQSLPVADSKPLVATRDIAGAVPMLRSQRYVAAISTHGGAVQLVPVTGNTPATYAIDAPRVRSVNLGLGITALALADLDSDGLQDLVFAQSDGQLGYVPQLPDGSFPASPTLLGATESGAISIAVGDLNGDKLPDLAVATEDKGTVYGNAHVFFNLPD